jgi:cGMP-dependent protein kinase
MEYLKGKELFYVIRDIGILNKYQAQFYIGSAILAIQYLHEKKYLFRDIKPENIMVLENGYIKLIDFGTATILKDKDKTNSIIGTPQYMAPEVILGDSYSFEVDYWSIGICLYEFCCGVLPFGENEEDPTNIYMSVINE